MIAAPGGIAPSAEGVTTHVPLIKPDLPAFEEVEDAFREVLASGRITNFGKYVSQFEAESEAFLGAPVATVSSGTMGLLFTLQAMGLRPGQRVILPSFTFMATAQAVRYAGGVPVFAEVEDDLTLSPTDLEALLARHEDVAAVIPVHMYGLPARANEIQAVVDAAAARRGEPITVLYDGAHAFGASRGGQRVGGFGTAEVFSLSVTKVLVSVEGGMVASHDPELIGRIRKMRNYGIEANYDTHWPGLNGKMSEFHAIVGVHNLRRLPQLLAERQRKARAYADRIERASAFRLTAWPEDAVHTFKDFTVVVPPHLKAYRDAIIAALGARGVETRAYFYPPVHEQRYFRQFADRPLPVTEDLSRRVITLPFYTSMTEAEMDYVSDALRAAEQGLPQR
jgi:dTDP-4-amino-4,6-dideoxygalactose transaminase